MTACALIPLVLAAVSAPGDPGREIRDFESFLAAYTATPPDERDRLARSFVAWQQEHGGFPVARPDGNVVFVYVGTGAESDVRVRGDFKTRSFHDVYWDEAGELLERAAPDGALFYRALRFEPDARLDYKLRIDGEDRLDPLNPRVVTTGVAGQASELVMPSYRRAEAALRRAGVARGELRVVDEPWARPKVTVYLPAGYDAAKRYPALYTADGSAWIEIVGLPDILDNLIADRRIEPVIAVMVDAAEDRSHWYQFDSRYLDYLEKVVRHVDGHFSTRARPGERLHIGSSAGGRITMYVGFERPGLFRNVAMFSPSLVGPAHYYEPYFSGRRSPPKGLRAWLSAGTYEPSILADTKTMEAYLKRAGSAPRAVYTHEGHSFGAWRNLTPTVLEHFFPARP